MLVLRTAYWCLNLKLAYPACWLHWGYLAEAGGSSLTLGPLVLEWATGIL